MKMYTELASWWPLLSAPEDYAEEAAFYHKIIERESHGSPETLLELGSGGGNNASHLKAHYKLTLVDLSPQMLEVSRQLNPDCEHLQGDMRSVRLGGQFEVVFIHDAIDYLTTVDDLRLTFETAFLHCKPGGCALFHPDAVKETFQPETSHGGHDDGERGLRYLEWSWLPDLDDDTGRSDYVFLLREKDGSVSCQYEQHTFGLFSRDTWLELIEEAGFVPNMVPFVHSEVAAGSSEVFVGVKPA